MTRQTKTERQRAEEALAVADRKVTRLRAERARLQGDLNQAVTALEEAERIQAYRRQHPALQNTTNTKETTHP